MQKLIYVFSENLADRLKTENFTLIKSPTEGDQVWLFALKSNSLDFLSNYADGEDFIFSNRLTF